MNQDSPKIFMYSLLLPLLWISASFLIVYFSSDVDLGIAGVVLVIYLSLIAICWFFSKRFNRDFYRNEKIRLTIYFLLWATLIRIISIYSISETLSSDALLLAFAALFVVDCLIIIPTVYSVSKRINGFFLRNYVPKNA